MIRLAAHPHRRRSEKSRYRMCLTERAIVRARPLLPAAREIYHGLVYMGAAAATAWLLIEMWGRIRG
jgi:hypothetical protein